MSHEEVPKAAFTSKLLDKDFHERLLSDLPQIVFKAGVPTSAVWSRLSDYCSPEELEWVRHLPRYQGLAFIGPDFPVLVEDKMMAITGVCLRNYTDARVMPVQEVVRRIKDDNMSSPTVLLIPNFCVDKDKGGDMPTWETTHLLGLLMKRASSNLKTIIYCSSLATVEKQYGEPFRQHIESKYSIATAHGVTLAKSKKEA